ncbi:unnamed protein product [Closterium sp. Yama58-4]|nr:unnamed protein product [Closterium sp. Yama58-4]
MALFEFARNGRLFCHAMPLLAAVALTQWMLACHVSAQPGPITFRARISNTSLVGITPAGRPAPASIVAQANATGTIAAFSPTLNLSTSKVPPFAIDQTYGSFQSAWTVPTATWRAVRGFFAPSRDFGGGPFAASNLTAPLASFGFVNGHLSTVAANQSRVHLFINSTAVFTARQLLLTANASASIMNIVMGQGHVRIRILLTGLADNPCAVAPTPPSSRPRP